MLLFSQKIRNQILEPLCNKNRSNILILKSLIGKAEFLQNQRKRKRYLWAYFPSVFTLLTCHNVYRLKKLMLSFHNFFIKLTRKIISMERRYNSESDLIFCYRNERELFKICQEILPANLKRKGRYSFF